MTLNHLIWFGLAVAISAQGANVKKRVPVPAPANQAVKSSSSSASGTAATVSPRPIRRLAETDDVADNLHYRFKLNTMFGINILAGSVGSGFLMGGQLGYAPYVGKPFYVGPAVHFSYFFPGSLLTALASAWYEARVFGAPRLSLSIGAEAGPAFASSLGSYPTLTTAAFLDACIVQEVNDLASVRGQFKPGFVGGYFAFQMNFNVQFRFQ